MDLVVLNTNMGKITLEMYSDHAPKVSSVQFSGQFVVLDLARNKTCKNFVELARRGYYNNVIFHRVIAVCRTSVLWVHELFTWSFRTSWHNRAIPLAPEEAEQASTGVGCKLVGCSPWVR